MRRRRSYHDGPVGTQLPVGQVWPHFLKHGQHYSLLPITANLKMEAYTTFVAGLRFDPDLGVIHLISPPTRYRLRSSQVSIPDIVNE